MKLFIDVTSPCRSVQSAGIQRMTRQIFAELVVAPMSVQFAGMRSAIFIQNLVRHRATTPESLVGFVLPIMTEFLS
jgi:hypothetical protein